MSTYQFQIISVLHKAKDILIYYKLSAILMLLALIGITKTA